MTALGAVMTVASTLLTLSALLSPEWQERYTKYGVLGWILVAVLGLVIVVGSAIWASRNSKTVRGLKASHTMSIEALQTAHNEKFTSQAAAHQRDVEDLNEAHRSVLEGRTAAHQKAVEELKTSHSKIVQQRWAAYSKARMEQEESHERQIRSLESDHHKKLAEQDESHSRVLAEQEQTHARMRAEQEQSFETLLNADPRTRQCAADVLLVEQRLEGIMSGGSLREALEVVLPQYFSRELRDGLDQLAYKLKDRTKKIFDPALKAAFEELVASFEDYWDHLNPWLDEPPQRAGQADQLEVAKVDVLNWPGDTDYDRWKYRDNFIKSLPSRRQKFLNNVDEVTSILYSLRIEAGLPGDGH